MLKSISLNESNLFRLIGLAVLAGGLVASLGLVQRAAADIVYYNPGDLTTSFGDSPIHFDLDDTAGGTLAVKGSSFAGSDFAFSFFGTSEKPYLDNANNPNAEVRVVFPTSDFTPKLSSGDPIDGTQPWDENAYLDDGPFGPNGASQWADINGMGYIGLRLNTGSGDYNYGWAQIDYQDTANTLTLLDFAYETTLNTPIAAGAGVVTVPEPGCVALLAAGTAGLGIWRRRKRKVS